MSSKNIDGFETVKKNYIKLTQKYDNPKLFDDSKILENLPQIPLLDVSLEDIVEFIRKFILTKFQNNSNGMIRKLIDDYVPKLTENWNYNIYVAAKKYFEIETENINNFIERIFVAWIFGFTAECPKLTHGVISKRVFEDKILICSDREHKRTIKKIVKKIYPKKKDNKKYEDDHEEDKKNSKTYLKNNPYLFTPVQIQFMFLGLKKTKDDSIINFYDKSLLYLYEDFAEHGIMKNNNLVYRYFDSDRSFYDLYMYICNPYAFTCNFKSRSDKKSKDIYNVKVIKSLEFDITNKKYKKSLGVLGLKILLSNDDGNTCLIGEPEKSKYDISYLRKWYGVVYNKKYTSYYSVTRYRTELLCSKYIANLIECENEHFDPTEKIFNVGLREKQRKAIQFCTSKKLSILSGTPGSGKSYTIIELFKHLIKKSPSTYVLSPTNQASVMLRKKYLQNKNEQQHINNISTIHSFLASNKETSNNPYYLIVDESSMIDEILMLRLLKLSKIFDVNYIFVGDENQLPPVGYGKPFQDIVNSEFNNIKLTENMRSEQKINNVYLNAYNILDGDYIPEYGDTFNKKYLYLPNEIEKTENFDTKNIVNLLKQNNITIDTDFTFITYTNKYCDIINILLSKILNNDDGNFVKIGNFTYKKSDKIIFLKKLQLKDSGVEDRKNKDRENELDVIKSNNSKTIAHKNERGVIKNIIFESEDRGYMDVIINEKSARLDFRKYKNNFKFLLCTYEKINISLAYCLTVHRSQGSEWQYVYFYINYCPQNVDKSLGYTAITRCKKECNIVTYVPIKERNKIDHFETLCNQSCPRIGNLCDRIRERLE